MAVAEEDLLEEDIEQIEDEDLLAQAMVENEVQLEPATAAIVKDLVDKIWKFVLVFSDVDMFPYQEEFGKRIIESVIINDGEELTGLFSRQSGKTETLANVVSALMVLLPRLARMMDHIVGSDGRPLLAKFKNGFWVGTFAPVENQAETLFGRIVSRLTSDKAMEIMLDPEIDDAPTGGGKFMRLKKSGSFVRMQTANPRAKVESKSYHLIIIDEAQGADEYMVRKSIQPMGAFYNATIVKIGTPDVVKGDFYKAIKLNKRRATKKSLRKNHYEFDWKHCARYNPNYKKYIQKEKIRIGEDSDEFRLSYCLEWLLDRGMFVTETVMEELGDKSMQLVHAWNKSPVVVGIDPARKMDSTVVTVIWVDWDRPDEFGYFDHRILNWLEIHGDNWEEQYFRIVDFLSNYDVLAVGVDAQGVGDAVAQRLQVLMPGVEVHALMSDRGTQSERWKHLMALIQRGMVSWPAHAKVRRTKTFRRFFQQMVDLEKKYEGPHLLAEAPDEAEAHDDYPDSFALGCSLTKDLIMPTIQVSASPFYSR